MNLIIGKRLLKISLSFFVLYFFISINAEAQGFEGVVNAFKSGNAHALASQFGSNVELTIKNTGNSYSDNQAEMILRNFFNTNSPKSFAVSHQGTSPEGSKYLIGNLVSSTGNYRTYVYAKPINGKLQILEIRIEE